MAFQRSGDRVQLDLSQEDYNALMLILGYASGHAYERDLSFFYSALRRLVNRLNEGNPNFRPYEIPPEFAPPTEPLQWGETFEKLGHDT